MFGLQDWLPAAEEVFLKLVISFFPNLITFMLFHYFCEVGL